MYTLESLRQCDLVELSLNGLRSKTYLGLLLKAFNSFHVRSAFQLTGSCKGYNSLLAGLIPFTQKVSETKTFLS